MSGLGKVTFAETLFIGIVIEGFFYGLYTAIFCIYIQYHASKGLGIDKRNILLYALCILYILSTVTVFLDTTVGLVTRVFTSPSESFIFRLEVVDYISIIINALCDFISQGILIYRCWVIWGRNIYVIIIPSVFALAFLATWLAIDGSQHMVPVDDMLFRVNPLGHIMNVTSLAISFTVNAVVTGLIVFKVLKVYGEVSFGDRTLGASGANAKLRSIIFIIIESGMATFIIQLIRVVFTILNNDAVVLFVGIHEMFNGLIPTTILVRLSMGLSYHDEKSMVETVASWRFVPYNQNPISETRGTEIGGQERVDGIGIQQNDDIQIIGI